MYNLLIVFLHNMVAPAPITCCASLHLHPLQERAELKRRRALEEAAAAARRNRLVVTIDLLGRKVLLPADQDTGGADSAGVAGGAGGSSSIQLGSSGAGGGGAAAAAGGASKGQKEGGSGTAGGEAAGDAQVRGCWGMILVADSSCLLIGAMHIKRSPTATTTRDFSSGLPPGTDKYVLKLNGRIHHCCLCSRAPPLHQQRWPRR